MKFKRQWLTPKRIVSALLQLLFFGLIFLAASWWQQKDMLGVGGDNQAPQLKLPNLQGSVTTLIPGESGEPMLLYFFAPWCRVCHLSIDNLQAIKDSEEHQNLDIYLVALDWQNQQEVSDFLKQHQLTVPVLLGNRQTSEAYKIKGFPSYYLISKDGTLVSKNMGYTTELGLRSRILLND